MKQSIKPKGFNFDINPAELGFETWDGGSNVLFPNGYAGAGPGWSEAVPGLLCKPLWILPVFTPSEFFWIYCGNTLDELAGMVAVTDGANHWDITPATGLLPGTAGDWTGGVLNGIPCLNNGYNPPMFWDTDPVSICLPLPGWPVGQFCKALRPFKYHLIAMNITDGAGEFPDLVSWSDGADPGSIPQTWIAAPENEAGEFAISATSGGIVDGGQMRDQFMVYKSGSSTIMQYVAGQFVFSNRKAFVTSGILARNCWQEQYGQHFVITNGDVIKHNGVEVVSIVDAVVRDYVFDQIDPVAYQATFIAFSHKTKELWVNFPKAGHIHADTALVLDVLSGSWGQIDFDREVAYMTRGILNDPGTDYSWDAQTLSWDEFPGSWNHRRFNPTADILVMADYNSPKLLAHDGFLREGLQPDINLKATIKDFGAPGQLKLVTAVWSHLDGGGSSEGEYFIRIGTQMETSDPITWSPRQSVNASLQHGKADFMSVGRYMSVEFSGKQVSVWRLNSLDIDYELQGAW